MLQPRLFRVLLLSFLLSDGGPPTTFRVLSRAIKNPIEYLGLPATEELIIMHYLPRDLQLPLERVRAKCATQRFAQRMDPINLRCFCPMEAKTWAQ